MKNEKDSLWIFLHVPRTGGNTLSEVIAKKFPKEQVLLTSHVRYHPQKIDGSKLKFVLGHATYYGIHKKSPNKNPRYFAFLRDPAERQISHYNYKMQYEKKRIPFETWRSNQVKNEMVHFLDLKFKGSESSSVRGTKYFMPIIKKLNYKGVYLIHSIIFKIFGLNKKNDLKKLENAKKLLKMCWFVGITEKSNEDFGFLLNAMGVRKRKLIREGKSKKILKLDKNLRDKIYKENPLDVELYNYALDLRKKRLNGKNN
ncbi:MAG: sulfotransferase family 2 domain-containing protein [archaeon]